MAQLPDVLTVVTLENKVLLPAVVMKITMRGRDAAALTRKHFRSVDQQKAAHLACIPLKPISSTESKEISSNAVAEAEKSSIVLRNNHNRSDEEPQVNSAFVKPDDKERLFDYGCAARIIRVHRSGLGVVSVFVEGVARVHIERIVDDGTNILAKVKYIERPTREITIDAFKDEAIAFRALCREFLAKMRELQIPDSLVQQLNKMVDNVSPVVLADLLVSIIETSLDEKLWMLSTTDVKERLSKMSEWMTRQLHVGDDAALNFYS